MKERPPQPPVFHPFIPLFAVPDVEPAQDSHSRKMVLIKTIETRNGEVRGTLEPRTPSLPIVFLSPSLAAADFRVLQVMVFGREGDGAIEKGDG